MGADIHVTVQRPSAFGGWRDLPAKVPHVHQEADCRSYARFARLGMNFRRPEVRVWKPLRGLPADFDRTEHDEGDFGFHSHSWLLVAEIVPPSHPEGLATIEDTEEAECIADWRKSLEHDFGPLQDGDRVVYWFDN